jgi:hypothetical protein
MLANDFAMPAEQKPTFKMIDKDRIQVSLTPVTPDPFVVEHTYDNLLKEREKLIRDTAEYVAAQQAKLDSIDAILTQFNLIGEKPIAEVEQLQTIKK